MSARLAIGSLCVIGMVIVVATACRQQPEDAVDQSRAGLRFSITEGTSANHFIQQDGISAHLNLQSDPVPRLIVALPAGNSGAALHFASLDGATAWGPVRALKTVVWQDGAGRALYGMQAEINVLAASLELTDVDVGSVRFLRGAVDYSSLPPRAAAETRIGGSTLRVLRERPDGLSSYFAEVSVVEGELLQGRAVRFVAAPGGKLKLRVTVASGDRLEVPVTAERLIAGDSTANAALKDVLVFLSYESKMLAGSWRFLTYFGRDTLLSLRLLMPILTAEAAEIGLSSVLVRVNDGGEVAHEEEIGELAVYRNIAERGTATAEPGYDYAMIDDNLLLAPVLNHYVRTFGAERAAAFLSGPVSDKESRRARLARNLMLVVQDATAFASDPAPGKLLAIKDGLRVGNWRDSQEGLAGGRYPYDVNAVLMPAALRAAADIVGAGLLGDDARDLPGVDALRRMASTWEAEAAGYFRVVIPAAQARNRLADYAEANGYPVVDVGDADLSFRAVALDARNEPIPVMHSDVGMDLLFLQRPEAQLAEIVQAVMRPFPAGLSTPVGVLAANPAFANAEEQELVTRNHYHGTVIWSWQQAMLIAGLEAQLARDDLSHEIRQVLARARDDVWRSVTASKAVINSELWSFAVRDGEFTITPFGQSAGHLTESNAAQLWSTVYLALSPVAATNSGER